MQQQSRFFTIISIILINLLINNQVFGSNLIPEQLNLTSRSVILLDHYSGTVLLEKNSDLRLPLASLTKMMTMYVIEKEIKAGRLSIDDEVTISKQAWQTSGSRMFVDVNSKVKVMDLIKGIIIQSGNDASVALAEHIAGNEQTFAAIMNDCARSLGMENTNFVNATGLPDPNHYSTAKDLAILAKAIIKEHPERYPLYANKSFVYNNIEQYNRNKLLWRNNLVDGIKTGQTDDAGYCLAASAIQDGTRLTAIVLGAKSDEIRTMEANRLLVWGFRFFTSSKLYHKGATLGAARVWGGTSKTISIGLSDDLYVTLLRNDPTKISTKIVFTNLIKAPVKAGDVVGKYIITLKEKVIGEYPIIALNEVTRGNLFYRLSDRISMYWNKEYLIEG